MAVWLRGTLLGDLSFKYPLHEHENQLFTSKIIFIRLVVQRAGGNYRGRLNPSVLAPVLF